MIESTIAPKFPTQESIDAAVAKLSPEDRKSYENLKAEYENAVKAEHPDHEKISSLIAAAQKILG